MNFLEELTWRGLLHQRSAEAELDKHLAIPMRVAYAGFDPTSDSLHIGNLIPITLLKHFQRAGHKPIILMGGGTGLIGDPSGRDDERSLLTREVVDANVASQKRIMEKLLDFDPALPNAAIVVNNIDWLDKLGFIEILRGVGKHFSINEMMQRESVKRRLEQREHGMSYTEFSYMILQAYDFLHLRREFDCTVQLAGSDQYGNMLSGLDLIRREYGQEDAQAFAVTAPLVTRSDGKKMSKSEGTALWLSSDTKHATSPYAFYQYWLNLPDADVVQWLRWYTLLDNSEIQEIAGKQDAAPQERAAQRALAASMTEMLHSKDQLSKVQSASEALFSGDIQLLDEEMLSQVFADVPHTIHNKSLLEGEGISAVEVLIETSLANSKREAKEFLGNGAISINGSKAETGRMLLSGDLLHGRTILVRRGKKLWHATRWE